MKDLEGIKYYSPVEEKINIISHAIGFILGIVFFVLLVTHATRHGNVWHIVSFSVFGASLIILYAASTVYHSAKNRALRIRLRIFDHTAIYILIAGTYTPFALVTLHGTIGWVLFGTAWGLASTGILLKLFFTGRYNLISSVMYVLMGSIAIFALKPLANKLAFEGLFWLFAGGLSYTIGAIIYSIKKIRFNHAIFHVFVLIGSLCHFISVFFYVLSRE